MVFPDTLPAGDLPKDGNHLVNDRLLSGATGIPYNTVGHYRRSGIIPPYDMTFPNSGHGGWQWKTVADFVTFLRMGKYGGNRVRRGKLVREAAEMAWPNGWGQQGGDAA